MKTDSSVSQIVHSSGHLIGERCEVPWAEMTAGSVQIAVIVICPRFPQKRLQFATVDVLHNDKHGIYTHTKNTINYWLNSRSDWISTMKSLLLFVLLDNPARNAIQDSLARFEQAIAKWQGDFTWIVFKMIARRVCKQTIILKDSNIVKVWPLSVHEPKSVTIFGWGLRLFITCSSFSKSCLSLSPADSFNVFTATKDDLSVPEVNSI